MNVDFEDDDPIEELHHVRDQLWRDAGGSWDRLFAGVRRRDFENRERVQIIPAPPTPPADVRKDEVA